MNVSKQELATQPAQHRLLLVCSPRTVSNLLLKILNLPNQTNVVANKRGGYCMYDLFTTAVNNDCLYKPVDQWTPAQKANWQHKYQDCIAELEKYSAQAADSQSVFFTKEHASWLLRPSLSAEANERESQNEILTMEIPESYGDSRTFSSNNITLFPDEYLRTWNLVFLIRHPALMFPSYHRAMMKMGLQSMPLDWMERVMTLNTTLRWTRMLYDWSLEQGHTPYLLDAHDVITNPMVLVRFCELTGLDAVKLRFEWDEKRDPPSPANTNNSSSTTLSYERRNLAREEIMLSTLLNSSGVISEKAPENIDVAAELHKWKDEFGDEVAMMIDRAVQESMPHYEYLKERRLRVDDM